MRWIPRDEWIAGIARAAKAAGCDLVVSRHPADLGDFSAYNVSERSVYDELDDSNILISRFSTCILEALAKGRRAIYYNPHGEKVDKFFEADAPLPIANAK